MELATRIAPLALARERSLPLGPPLDALVPGGALVRGQVVSCRGPAALSLSMAAAAAATTAGSWLAVVGVPEFGVEAAAEHGVALERVVAVAPTGAVSLADPETWATVMGAVLDGFELVVTRVPARLRAGLARRVQNRAKAKGAVVITIGAIGADRQDVVGADLVITSGRSLWEGIGAGCGHLHGRRVAAEVSGRRVPGLRRGEVWLPQRSAPSEPGVATDELDGMVGAATGMIVDPVVAPIDGLAPAG